MRIKQYKDRLTMENGPFSLLFAAFLTVLLPILTAYLCLVYQSGDDFLLLLFVSLLTLVAVPFLTWYLLRSIGYKVVMNAVGVREERIFLKNSCRSYRWEEISDWGYSYSHSVTYKAFFVPEKRTRFYFFYFSNYKISEKSEGIKDVTRQNFFVLLNRKDVEEKLLPRVIPFVQTHLSVAPFSPLETAPKR